MGVKLITPPAVEPISLAEAKSEYCRVDHSDDDQVIGRYITEGRQQLDGPNGKLWRMLITQTWDLYLDKFPANEIEIPYPPLQSITSVNYTDVDGNEQLVSSSDYTIDAVSEPAWLLPVTGVAWPSTMDTVNAVRIRFVAGYGNAGSDVPAPIRNWIGKFTAWRLDSNVFTPPDFGSVNSYRVKWFV